MQLGSGQAGAARQMWRDESSAGDPIQREATGATPDEITSGRGAAPPGAAPPGTAGRPEIEVLRPDPWWRRQVLRWQRAGRAEGARSETHPVRGALLLAALGLLTWWQPGAAVFLGILLVIIVIHEGGHLLVARWCGMRPTEYFVGFGPTIWARTTAGGLRYGVKAVVFGGYVKIPGMGPTEEVEASLEPYTYRAATRPRRLAVILAGVAANLLLALVLIWGFAMWSPSLDVGPVRAATGSVSLMQQMSTDSFVALGDLVTGADDYASSVATGSVPENRMISAVGGAQLTNGLLEQHPSRMLLLAGLFSTSIAVFNLLPLLPLDGGHAAIVVVEGFWARVRRQPRYRLDPNRFRVVAAVVVVALLALGASSMYLDLIHPLTAPTG